MNDPLPLRLSPVVPDKAGLGFPELNPGVDKVLPHQKLTAIEEKSVLSSFQNSTSAERVPAQDSGPAQVTRNLPQAFSSPGVPPFGRLQPSHSDFDN